MKWDIYRNRETNYRVKVIQYDGNNSGDIEKFIGRKILEVKGKDNYLKIDFNKVYQGYFITQGFDQIDAEVFDPKQFKKKFREVKKNGRENNRNH